LSPQALELLRQMPIRAIFDFAPIALMVGRLRGAPS